LNSEEDSTEDPETPPESSTRRVGRDLRLATVTGLTLAAMVIGGFACESHGAAQSTDIGVAVVERSDPAVGQGGMGFSILINGARSTTPLEVLNSLSRTHRKRLALLVADDVPIGALGTLLSMSSKAGYLPGDVVALVFDSQRALTLRVAGFRNVRYSTDPKDLAGIFE